MKFRIRTLFLILLLSVSVEKNAFADDYHHNLTSNPIATAFGLSNIEYSYNIADHWTVGVNGSTGKMRISDFKMSRSSWGGVARYYFEPLFHSDSWYLTASADNVSYDASIFSRGIEYTGALDEAIVAGGGGYHWFWRSFNMNLGALISSQSSVELKDAAGNKYKNDANARLDFEFNMGWAF